MTTTRTSPAGAAVPSTPVRAALALLRWYQAAASGRASPCRFYPSCSTYAAEAFTVHGFWRGLALTARRLVRCRPFGPHGVDLVPLPVHAHAHAHTHAHADGRRG
jgi:putative membrane protein insertion efficiency factor